MALWQWIRDGLLQAREPDEESERAYEAELRLRPPLDDDAFYERYYAGSGVPRSIPLRYRKLLRSILGIDLAALQPQDNIALIFDGLDFADVLYRINREFRVSIPLESVSHAPPSSGDASPMIDGTFDSVVRYLTFISSERTPQESSPTERDEPLAGP